MLVISLTDMPTNEERQVLTAMGAEIVETRQLTGVEHAVDIIVQLSAPIVPSVLAYLALKFRARARMSLSYKGLVLTGFTEESAERILKDILDREQSRA